MPRSIDRAANGLATVSAPRGVSKRVALAALLVLVSTGASGAGILTLDFAANSVDDLRVLRLGPDGRIFAEVANSLSGNCGIFALDADGTLVASYAMQGRLIPGSCAPDLRVAADLTLQSIEGPNAQDPWHVRRRDVAGTLLSTSADLYPRPPASNQRRTAEVLATQSTGKVVVGGNGTACSACTPNWILARLNTDGTLDTTFGGGLVIRDVGGSQIQQIASLHILAGDKILAAGRSFGPLTASTVLTRFDADGNVDASFGANGQLLLPAGPGVVALDASGRIYVPDYTGSVVRLSADGTLDAGFTGSAAQAGVTVTSIAVDSAGRTVIFGRQNQSAGYIGRLATTGAYDAGFAGGNLLVNFGASLRAASDGEPVCLGALQISDRPILACSILGPTDPDVTARTDLAIARHTTTGTLDLTFAASQASSDTYPDAISFATATVPYGTANVLSAPATITGINSATSVEISGAGAIYSIGCNGPFTSSAGVITAGQTICVRQHAPSQPGGSVQSRLEIGGRAATFTVMAGSQPADSVPDAFTFTDQSGVATSTAVTSNSVTISGITGFTTASIVNGQFSIGCDPLAFGPGPVTITNGAVLCVRHTSAALPETVTTTTLTVGGVSAAFRSTTIPADTTPAAFAFTSQSGVTAGSTVTSNVVTISGINTSAPVSITGGEYSIGCSGAFTSAAGTVASGAGVCVRHVAASAASTAITTTLTVGGVSAAFISTTAAASSSGGGGGSLDYALLAWLAGLALLRRWRIARSTADLQVAAAP